MGAYFSFSFGCYETSVPPVLSEVLFRPPHSYSLWSYMQVFVSAKEINRHVIKPRLEFIQRKTRPDTRHKLFAVFVSARREKAFQTDRLTDRPTDRRTNQPMDGHTLL